jgi:hypothetical protein
MSGQAMLKREFTGTGKIGQARLMIKGRFSEIGSR